jgi:hypothetical protein
MRRKAHKAKAARQGRAASTLRAIARIAAEAAPTRVPAGCRRVGLHQRGQDMTSTTNSDIAKKHLKLRVRLPLYPARDQMFDP